MATAASLLYESGLQNNATNLYQIGTKNIVTLQPDHEYLPILFTDFCRKIFYTFA